MRFGWRRRRNKGEEDLFVWIAAGVVGKACTPIHIHTPTHTQIHPPSLTQIHPHSNWLVG